MTADRRADRRLARIHHASPYSQKTRNAKRSQQSKKSSGWSLAGFLSYFNPLRSRHSEEPEEETEEETSQDELETNQSSQSSHDVFGSRAQPAQPPPPSPPAARPPNFFSKGPSPPAGPSSPQLTSLPEPSASPLKNVDAVKTYLEQNGGRSLNQVEIAGLVSMLQDSIDGADDDAQPFRFSKSPSRAGSPAASSLFPTASSSTMSSTSTTTPKTPPRTLSKNPNGTYKWQGVGSARRNRYHSPAFGSPGSGNKIKLPPAATAKSDSKRRRVGRDAETSSPQKTSSSRQSSAEPTVAGPSTTSSTGAPNVKDTAENGPPQSKQPVNGINTTSRLNKATAPAVSSPLRQAWGQDDLPSPNSSPTSASKPSRAATFMTELIREATPPKRPDIANPYQTASPVKVVKPPTKKPVRKPRAVPKQPLTEEEKQQPGMTMQAIIEATLPKGSKRARPPAHLSVSTNGFSETSSVNSASQSPSPPPKQSTFLSHQNGSSTTLNGYKAVTIEEVEDEEEFPSPKKQKKTPAPAEPMIVEIDDPSPPSQPFLRPSEIIEPGDPPQLQTSGLNGTSSSSAPIISPTTGGRSFFGLKSSAPKEPSKLRFSIKADRDETASSASSVSPTAATSPKNAKAEVLSIAVSELPAETFAVPRRTIREGRSSGELKAEKEVRGFADDDILMDDAWNLSSTSAGPSNLNKAGPGPIIGTVILPAASSVFDPLTASSTTTTAPTTNSAGPSNLNKSGPGPIIGTVTLPTSSPVFDPLPTSSTTIATSTTNGGFNWGAAGLKPPPKQEDGWECGTCDLMNPTSATEKCTVCDTPKSAVPPSVTVLNPPSALFNTISTTTDTAAATATTGSGSGGFNWGAAGFKPPTTTMEGWKCGTCDLMNSPSATEKCTVCDAPKPGAGKSSTISSVFMPKPPSTPLVFGSGSTSTMMSSTNSGSGGFNWGAAGLKPPTPNTEGWRCGTCDLMNPTLAEECTVCDAPKPGASSSGSGSGNVFSMPTPPSGPLLFGTSNSTSSTSATSSGFSFGAPKMAGSGFNPSFTGFGAAPSTSTTTMTTGSGTGGGFNWGAAGLGPPSEGGGWRCKGCDLMNSASATEKCTVCDTPKP